ncbi:ependymin [Trichomycterus rosablanca]|uniref:ependymin n=1 Tax=Trichomycterus rosablanca TaxID=2290929 RepID=UPI002F3608BB
MRAIFLLSFSLILAFSALAQKPHHCKSPPFLEGKLEVIFPEGKTFVFEQFYYDAVEERIRVIEAGKEGTQKVFVDRLMLYRERVYYEIHYHNKTCVKNSLSDAFSPLAIPLEAQHRAQFVLGSLSAPGQGVLVNNWVGSIPKLNANYSLSFTEFGCIPITTLYSVQGAGHFLSSFFDVVIGLTDPEVFVPPSFCSSAELVKQDDVTADFFTALL